MLSQAVQDYLKTIYKLEEEGAVSTTKIAKILNISGASVTGMLKRLSNMKLVDYNSYKGVKLTDSGRKIALEILRHHRLIELYLRNELGFTLDQVHEEACRLEHYVSDEFVDRINQKLGNPEFSPMGNPIPSKDGDIPELNENNLIEVEPGNTVVIQRLSDNDKEMLAYFEKMGLIPGVEIKVLDKAPFNGPLTISYTGENQIIGNEIARNIYVEEK